MSCRRNAGFPPASSDSRGEKFRDALEKQRGDTDARRKALADIFNGWVSNLPPAIAERIRKASEIVGAVDGRRREISALTLAGPDSFAFFTGAIDNYLVAVADVGPTLSDAGMMRAFSAYVMFLAPRSRPGANAPR